MRIERRALTTLLLLVCGGGCMLISPLEDYPTGSAASSGAGAGPSAGSGNGGDDAGGDGPGGKPATAGSSGTGGSAPFNGKCETNADCVVQGGEEPYRCRPSDNTCQVVKNDFCPVSIGPAGDPNAIFFGSFSTINFADPERDSIIYAQELARQELTSDAQGGLPDGPDGVSRPLVMVVCDNSADNVEGSLKHLIDDLEIKALVATLKPGDLRRAFETHKKKDVFYLSPGAVTESLIKEPDDGRIWNLLGQPSDFTPAYVKLLEHTEEFVKASRGLQPSDPIKVFVVSTEDAFDRELYESLLPQLTFNGTTVTQNDDDGFYEDALINPDDPKLDELAQSMLTFRPHIIVSAASELTTKTNGLFQKIESQWTVGGNDPRPTYLLSPYNAGDLTNIVGQINASIARGDTEPERRFFGLSVASAENTKLQNDYAKRLHGPFDEANPDSANYYDAVYYLAYAMYAAGTEEPLSGTSIAAGMKRLLSGESFVPGPMLISSVFDTLRDPKATITLDSTLGPPAFDAETGVRSIDSSVFCFKVDTPLITLRLDVRRYDRELEDFRGNGEFCFSGFL